MVWQKESQKISEWMEMEFFFRQEKEKDIVGMWESGPEKMPWEAQKFWKLESIIGFSHSRDFIERISLSNTTERSSCTFYLKEFSSKR